jgi:hypothetical protein
LSALHSDGDLADHLVRRNDAAVRRVSALFGEFLVLELDRGRARPLIAANSVAHIEEPAIAGVAVGDERRLRHARHGLDPADHVGVTGKPGVGEPKMGGDRAIAGHVERLKTHRRRHPQRNHVVDARRCDHTVLGAGVQNFTERRHDEDPTFPSRRPQLSAVRYRAACRRAAERRTATRPVGSPAALAANYVRSGGGFPIVVEGDDRRGRLERRTL